MGKQKRFQIVHEESVSMMFAAVVLLDTLTGVLYLQTNYSGTAGGLTPLLGPDGKPVIWDVERLEEDEK